MPPVAACASSSGVGSNAGCFLFAAVDRMEALLGTAFADPAALTLLTSPLASAGALPEAVEARLEALFLPFEVASESYLSVRLDVLLSNRERERCGESEACLAAGDAQTGGDAGSAISSRGAKPIEEMIELRLLRRCETDILEGYTLNRRGEMEDGGKGRGKKV